MYYGNTNDVHRQKFGNNWVKKDYIKKHLNVPAIASKIVVRI